MQFPTIRRRLVEPLGSASVVDLPELSTVKHNEDDYCTVIIKLARVPLLSWDWPHRKHPDFCCPTPSDQRPTANDQTIYECRITNQLRASASRCRNSLDPRRICYITLHSLIVALSHHNGGKIPIFLDISKSPGFVSQCLVPLHYDYHDNLRGYCDCQAPAGTGEAAQEEERDGAEQCGRQRWRCH